jgi:UDP-glucose 4-epimerase
MRVLVTGGAGFVGANLVGFLAEEGHEVTVLDDLSAGAPPDWWRQRSGPRCVQGRIEDSSALRRATRGAEAVVHLAARPGVADSVARPDLDFGVNVLGTFNAVDAARRAGVRTFVFASSGAVLAGATPPLREDMPAAPLSPYGASKLYGEGITAAARVFDMVGISLRFANVYGPLSAHKKSVISLFIRRALSHKPFVVYGDGNQTRDFLYVEDVCTAIEATLRATDPGIYHLGTGVETSVNELVEKVARACDTNPAVERKPPRAGDAARSFVDLSSAQRALGWNPRVDLEEGLRRTVEWMRRASL